MRRLAVCLLVLWPFQLTADVEFDGSTGGPAGTLTGNIEVLEQHGLVTPAGDALLHSFLRFGITASESVSFTHTTPTIQNIIARVTGTEASLLEGRLASDAPLWLLNPNGVVLGPSAQIDVQGAFRTNSTVDAAAALILADGRSLTVDSDLNTLTVATPAAFGFATDVPLSAGDRVSADATLGSAVNATPSGNGTSFTITGGTASGVNLFHSFSRFSIFNDDSAAFVDNSATPFANVVARVTGPAASYVTGDLQTSGSGLAGSKLWLLNPAGVFLGEGASLNVANAFAFGAADFLQTDAGDMFFADSTGSSTLFAQSPAAFGFSTSSSAGLLSVRNFVHSQSVGLGNTISDRIELAGGSGADIYNVQLNLLATSDLSGALVETFNGTASVRNSMFAARTTDQRSSGSHVFRAPNLEFSGGRFVTETTGTGSAEPILVGGLNTQGIVVRGGTQFLSDASGGLSGAPAGGVFLIGSGDVSVTGSATDRVDVRTVGSDTGSVGPVFVSGNTVTLERADLASNSALVVPPDPDDINGVLVQAPDLVVLSDVNIENNTSGTQQPGGVFLTGGGLVLVDSRVSSTTSGTGNSGSIRLEGTDALFVVGSSEVVSSTTAGGDAGTVTLLSLGDVTIDGMGQRTQLRSESSAASGAGSAGEILAQSINGSVTYRDTDVSATTTAGLPGFVTVSAPSIAVENANLSVSSSSDLSPVGLSAGIGLLGQNQVQIAAGSSLSSAVSGLGSSAAILITGLDVDVMDATVEGSTSGAGAAADIFVSGPFIGGQDLSAEADIRVANSTFRSESTGSGQFGQISLTGGVVEVVDQSLFTTATSSSVPTPLGTDLLAIQLQAANDLSTSNSTFSSVTTGAADAGRITLQGAPAEFLGSSFLTSSSGAGAAGQILIGTGVGRTGDVTIADGTQIRSDTQNGFAGTVQVAAVGNLVIRGDDTSISTNSRGLADTGFITLNAGLADGTQFIPGNLSVLDGATIESRAFSLGNSNAIQLLALGGALSVVGAAGNPSQILSDSQISQGGNISLSGLQTNLVDGVVAASAGASGSGGNIFLNTELLRLTRSAILAQAEGGNGGQIDLIGITDQPLFFIGSDSTVNADSQSGNAGTVTVSAPDTGINSALSSPEVDLLVQPPLAEDACAPVQSGEQSTLYVRKARTRVKRPDGYLTGAISVPASEACR